MSILPLLESAVAIQVGQLVLKRLASGHHGGSLVARGDSLKSPQMAVVKYALVELRNLNPMEELSDPETALLRGISLDTLKSEKEAKKLAEINEKENRRKLGGK